MVQFNSWLGFFKFYIFNIVLTGILLIFLLFTNFVSPHLKPPFPTGPTQIVGGRRRGSESR